MPVDESHVQRLLHLISPQNGELVARWAEALRGAGGFYAEMEQDGLEAVAVGTLSLLASALRLGELPPTAERRYVDPPPYRHQPLDQFVLAGLLVDRLLRDYLFERAPDPETATAAMARVDPVLAGAIVRVVRLRQQRLGAGQLVADIGKLLGRARNARRAFDAVTERIAQALNVDACLLIALDATTAVLSGASDAIDDAVLAADHTEERDAFGWLDEVEDDRLHGHALDGRGSQLERALHAAGMRHLSHRSLVTQGRLVGALVFAGDRTVDGQYEEHVDALSPLLAAQLGYVRQTGALQRADAAIDDLFDASPNMMVELDRLGRILRTNDRFRREIGMPGDVVGMPLMWLVHPAWGERFNGLWARLESEDRLHEARIDLIAADSRRRALALEAHWIHNDAGERTTCLVALWNVTDQVVRAEEDKVRIDELSAFAHHVAHDLQAPLRTIAGFTALLADELPAEVDPELHDYAERAQEAAERAGELVQGLLRFAHGTRTDGHSRVVTLDTLLEDVRIKLAADLEDSGGALVVGADDSRLLGDEVTLATLLGNLVANALRYAGAAAPRVEVGVATADPGWATLYVRDNGVGIPAEDQERIFGAFVRGATDQPGSGLGLAIVRRIARAHGGDVTVESALGEGSTFSVRLPTP
ncbi:MAG: PAS domain-containing sensor histidine kinase [bacterium]|nr:PAS domain-containing sensor histidine kinase [Myxococcales bacterium]MCB9542679.1 PAS domain-containing sensor histidine kinase [Myxococcales bacterium]MCB9552869.1 PAS domain-containing sensor histidine kinase [Myxococcales bacterium]